MTKEEILVKYSKNYKKTVERDEKTLYHLQINGYEAMLMMSEYASQEVEKERERAKEEIDSLKVFIKEVAEMHPDSNPLPYIKKAQELILPKVHPVFEQILKPFMP